MSNGHKTIPAILLFSCGCLLTCGLPGAAAQDKPEPGKSGPVFTKADKLAAEDEKDNGPHTKNSHRKLYKIKLTAGQAYRIDLTSKDFDTFLRSRTRPARRLPSTTTSTPTTSSSIRGSPTSRPRRASTASS